MARNRIPKAYGQSIVENCPFCGKVATAMSEQGAAVCSAHTTMMIVNVKCSCGDYLDLLKGKYGAYFNCLKCGNVNYKKGLDRWRASGCAFEEKDNEKKRFRDEFKRKWGVKNKRGLKNSASTRTRAKSASTSKEIVISSRDSFWFD
jgi:hypothetical protein